jgi:TolB-like protein/Tfp pilus assembly protein PilF
MQDTSPDPGHPSGPPSGGSRSPSDFFSELKRRKVYRVGAAYLAVAFAALEGAQMVFPTLGLGPGAFNVLVILSLLGFPLALALAWTFDVTETGIRRTEALDGGSTSAQAPDRWIRLKAALVGAGFVGVVWMGVRAWQPLNEPMETGVPVEEPTLAVLPLSDFSPGGDRAYLADGLHEEILHQLAQVPGIRLTSRTSSSLMRGLSPDSAAEALGVRYVLEGSVRVAQDSLLLTIQLIDTFTDEHLWSEELGRRYTLEGLFGIQQALAQRVAAALGGTLSSPSLSDLATPPTDNLDAYNEFLRGLYQESQFDTDALWAATHHYERAIQLDPEFGRAHAKLAVLLAILNNYGGVTQGELFPRIREHADLALQYASGDPSSYMAKMSYTWPMDWNWEESRRLLEEALALDPNHVDALWALAEWYGVIAGEPERGIDLIQRAFRVDPFSPTLHSVRWWILYNAQRYSEGLGDLEAVLAVDPSNRNANLNLVSTLALSGRQPESRERMAALLPTIPKPRTPSLAAHLARAGDTATAWEVLREAVERKESGGSVPASGIAAGYAVLGQVDEALNWLERSFREEGGIYYLRTPDWDNLAGSPRFQALWNQVGLMGEHPGLR